jgi:hypothetical protein
MCRLATYLAESGILEAPDRHIHMYIGYLLIMAAANGCTVDHFQFLWESALRAGAFYKPNNGAGLSARDTDPQVHARCAIPVFFTQIPQHHDTYEYWDTIGGSLGSLGIWVLGSFQRSVALNKNRFLITHCCNPSEQLFCPSSVAIPLQIVATESFICYSQARTNHDQQNVARCAASGWEFMRKGLSA